MKRTMGGAAMLAALMTVAPMQGDAQMRPGRGMMLGAPGDSLRGPGVEMILRERTQLELTDDQVEQLQALREETVQRRTAHRAQMEELRSQVRAGDITMEQLRDVAEARRTAAAEVRRQQRERIDEILTDAQEQKLDEWAGQARAYRMGRMDGMRGAGMRGQRPGMRGGQGAMGARGFRRGGAGMDGCPGFGARMGPRGGGFGPGR